MVLQVIFIYQRKSIYLITTLLDLVRGKGERLSNIKIIADFFGVQMSYLIDEPRKIVLLMKKII